MFGESSNPTKKKLKSRRVSYGAGQEIGLETTLTISLAMQSTPFAITITLILVTIYVIIVQNYATEKKLNNTVKTAIDEQQYQFMVNRAKELTNRYQMLSESLRGQRLDDFSNVTVHKYSTADDARNIIASEHGVTLPHDATQKDMVVGMAQDTDPKNMVV